MRGHEACDVYRTRRTEQRQPKISASEVHVLVPGALAGNG